jgi:hypothetical protein
MVWFEYSVNSACNAGIFGASGKTLAPFSMSGLMANMCYSKAVSNS